MGVQNGANNIRNAGDFRSPSQIYRNTEYDWKLRISYPISAHSRVRPSKYLADGDSKKRRKFANVQNSPEFSEFAEIFPTFAQIGAVVDIRDTAGNWLFAAQFPCILASFRITSNRWKFKISLFLHTAGNFRPPFADLPKHRLRLEIGHFYPTFTNFWHPKENITQMGIRNVAEYSRIPEISGILNSRNFLALAQIGALLDIRNTTSSWIFLSRFTCECGHFPKNLHPPGIQMALAISGPPAPFGALSRICQKTQNTTGNCAFFTHYPPILEYAHANIEPIGIQKSAGNSRTRRIPPNFTNLQNFFDFCANRRIRGYPRYDWKLVIRGSTPSHFAHLP